jgi:glyoxylase-like metal-dependent hydrolase (beta-lactamase superfamily II)
MAEHIKQVSVGQFDVHIISEGVIKVHTSQAFGDRDEALWRPHVTTDAEDRMDYGLNIVHVKTEHASVLIDTGIGERHPTRTRTEERFPMEETQSLLWSLEAMEISRLDITHVLTTHAHGDHFMGHTILRGGERVATFPNAEYFMMEQDFNPKKQAKDSPFVLHFPVLVESGHLNLIEKSMNITPGIRMIHSPGESPGHAIVEISSEGETMYFLGDLFHEPLEISHMDWVWQGRDQVKMIQSREELVKLAAEKDAVLVTAHFPFPGMGRVSQERHSPSARWTQMNTDEG